MAAGENLNPELNPLTRILTRLLALNGAAVFCVWFVLFVSKWFPGLPYMTVMREWLYRFF
jgi:hypothetical protein